MLELFVLSICLKTTTVACENSAVAYYEQSGIQRVVTQKTQHFAGEYPLMSTVVAVGATAANGTAVLPVGAGKSLTFDSKQTMIGYKWGF